MATQLFSPGVLQTLTAIQEAAYRRDTKRLRVDGTTREVPYPYPSPADWRDQWMYFIFLDRFCHPAQAPASAWNGIYDYRQGGNFRGVLKQLDYLAALGVQALWLSPVLKNSRPDWPWNYHGYATQDFLTIDGRFGSDGMSATAEGELIELVEQAHARGIYVVLDIVMNHTARVFDYVYQGQVTQSFQDKALLNQVLGGEPPVQWLNGFGYPRADWQDQLPPAAQLSADDAIWPDDLHNPEFFRRRGKLVSDHAAPGGFAKGDFDTMRQLVIEYDAGQFPHQQAIREQWGKNPVLSILVQIHQYLIAKFDLDGFRIDTVKYVDPGMIEVFGNAIREFSLSIGKKNFFMFGEVYDDEETIARFVGRNNKTSEGYGIDAALDFPLFYILPGIAKGSTPVEDIRRVYRKRKDAEEELLSTHGEAGRFFVTFLDNHDQHERFNHPLAPPEQVGIGLAALFCLQGIPCLYYGTEQGLAGIKDGSGKAVEKKEAVREALWGKGPNAFDQGHPLFVEVQALAQLRADEPALRYGRQYFRHVSGNGVDFGFSEGKGGILAFSRILYHREVLFVANTSFNDPFAGFVLVDRDLTRSGGRMKVRFSNKGTMGMGTVQKVAQARFYEQGQVVRTGEAACLYVELAPMEVQVLVPA